MISLLLTVEFAHGEEGFAWRTYRHLNGIFDHGCHGSARMNRSVLICEIRQIRGKKLFCYQLCVAREARAKSSLVKE